MQSVELPFKHRLKLLHPSITTTFFTSAPSGNTPRLPRNPNFASLLEGVYPPRMCNASGFCRERLLCTDRWDIKQISQSPALSEGLKRKKRGVGVCSSLWRSAAALYVLPVMIQCRVGSECGELVSDPTTIGASVCSVFVFFKCRVSWGCMIIYSHILFTDTLKRVYCCYF